MQEPLQILLRIGSGAGWEFPVRGQKECKNDDGGVCKQLHPNLPNEPEISYRKGAVTRFLLLKTNAGEACSVQGHCADRLRSAGSSNFF